MQCNGNNAHLRSVELQKFSDNAAKLLLRRGKLADFFESLGYEVEPHGEGYRGMCPACLSSFCFIGTNGNQHKIYWRCFDSQCPSNTGKTAFCRNLLGLIRGQVEGHGLGTAIEVIASFLGFKGRSWDITNGRTSPDIQRRGGGKTPPF